MTPEQSALSEAIEIAGGQSELARKISLEAGGLVKQQQVWNWLHREKKAPIKHTVAVFFNEALEQCQHLLLADG